MHCLLILNWFNPILWYAYYAMREDQEIACDNLALTFINPEEKIAYGQTIITLLEQYSTYYRTPTLANFSRNKAILKRRIIMIKNLIKLVPLVCSRIGYYFRIIYIIFSEYKR